MATAFVAAIGDVDLCCYRTYRHFHEFAHVVGYFPVLGFAGDRARGIRDRKKRGEGNREFVVKEMEIKRDVMEIIENLLFGENVTYLQCSKCKVKLSSVDTIVLHGTVGAGAISSALYLCRPDTSVSTHVVVGRDAEIFQLLPFDVKAWHAGKSFHAGRVNLNDCSIGIELDNLGQLRLEGGRFVAECGKEVPVGEVYTEDSGGEPTYWHDYTDVQMRVLNEVCGLLVDTYPIGDIVGHSDVTSRKVDPGPALRVAEWIQYY